MEAPQAPEKFQAPISKRFTSTEAVAVWYRNRSPGDVNCIRKTLIAGLLLAVFSAHGASVKAGKERLRELVVMPSVDANFGFPEGASRADFLEDYLVPAEIDKLRAQVKESPDNPECLLQLGDLLNRANDRNDARGCYEQAEEAARKKSAMRPQDGLTLTYLAKALDHLGKDDEAESVFRKATVVSSNEWKCWAGLGRFLGNQAWHGLVPKGYSTRAAISVETCLSVTKDYKPLPDVLAKSAAMRKESEQCFERAISLAPKEPDVYLARAASALNFAVEDWLIHFYRDGKPVNASEYLELNCPSDQVQYREQAARLCPDDYRVIGFSAWQDSLSATLRVAQQNPGDKNPPLGHLPKKTQAFVHETIAHLQTLSQSSDKITAAGALQYLGLLKISLKDYPGAKADFRHSATLEPANDRAWDLLLGLMIDNASPDELVDVCQARLKYKNSALNHLLLAKALIKQNKPDDADVQLEQAQELQPDSVIPYLISAALDMQLSADERRLSAAMDQMTRAGKLLGKGPNSEKNDGLARAYLLDWAILSALFDKPEEAKNLVNHVLDCYPNDQTAKEIMSAIQ